LQKNTLFSGSIIDNLRWGKPDATLEECQDACRMACADEFISALPDGYDTHVEEGGANFSGGQKQRLCIARALIKRPKVIILDDSTSACDTHTDQQIREAFRVSIPGTTKIIISQRISSIIDCDKIIVMENGKMAGFDTHENLLRDNEIYKDIYSIQTDDSADFDMPAVKKTRKEERRK
jgi:ATP-binding cassette subfamily B protein